jgi:hypothetical protein
VWSLLLPAFFDFLLSQVSVELFHQIVIWADIKFHFPPQPENARFIVDRYLASTYAMPVHLALSDTGPTWMTC